MSLMDDSSLDRKSIRISNILYDTFQEVVELYDECDKDIWEESQMICLYNTRRPYGKFTNSDLIIGYDYDTHKPVFVTERIFRKNYTWIQWIRERRRARNIRKWDPHQEDWSIDVGFGISYIDYTYEREDRRAWMAAREERLQSLHGSS